MNTKSILSASLLILGTASLAGQALTIQVGSGQAFIDDPVRIPISVDDSTGIVGASFVITYDTEALDVSVTSDFFPSLIEQLEETGAFVNGDPFVDLDIVTQGSSIETSEVPGTGIAISAIRVLPADGSEDTLFIVSVSRKDGVGEGTFDISIEPLTVSNVNAGYPPEGEQVPLILGLENETYMVLLDPVDVPANIDPGVAGFLALLADTDGDHMPDSWEQQYFENLDQLVPDGDFDHDGIGDLAEYFLGLNPKERDEPGVLYLQSNGDAYGFYFPMRNLHGFNYFVEWSADAIEWIPDNVILGLRPDLDMGSDWTLVEALIFPGYNPHGTIMARVVIDPD